MKYLLAFVLGLGIGLVVLGLLPLVDIVVSEPRQLPEVSVLLLGAIAYESSGIAVIASAVAFRYLATD